MIILLMVIGDYLWVLMIIWLMAILLMDIGGY